VPSSISPAGPIVWIRAWTIATVWACAGQHAISATIEKNRPITG
jgi:hypothetical protein